MTRPHSKAWDELQWADGRRDRLVFPGKVSVGQLVFKYDDSAHEWKPYWVVDENDGLYEIIAAGDDEVNKEHDELLDSIMDKRREVETHLQIITGNPNLKF